jgi:hypothetical protein
VLGKKLEPIWVPVFKDRVVYKLETDTNEQLESNVPVPKDIPETPGEAGGSQV